jgi:histidinol-phosphate aminotransferase
MTTPGRTRAEWSDLVLYRPPREPVVVNLSDNTNRFGVPPEAFAVLRAPEGADATRYPDAYGAALKDALAAFAGARPSEIATGCGSDDILDSSFRAFARPGETLAYLTPTFPMAAYFARMNGIDSVATTLAPDGTFDPEALLARDPAVVYLCSPNNPTGASLDPAAVEYVIANAPRIVVLDEAYADFTTGSQLTKAPARPGLIVARTFSKAFGLAGLRVGWACASEDLIANLELSRGPFKVGALAERVALTAITRDLDWVRANAAEAVRMRGRLAAELRLRGFATLPSEANFLMVPLPGSAAIATAMRGLGVAVRPFSALPGIGDALRISVAPWPEMERMLAALEEAVRCA